MIRATTVALYVFAYFGAVVAGFRHLHEGDEALAVLLLVVAAPCMAGAFIEKCRNPRFAGYRIPVFERGKFNPRLLEIEGNV